MRPSMSGEIDFSRRRRHPSFDCEWSSDVCSSDLTPFDQPCCGSVFKTPGGPRTAGALIDEAGLRGFTIGGAQVSSLHANYIVNPGPATASDVLKLIEHVRKTVAKKMGVELELEVKVVG